MLYDWNHLRVDMIVSDYLPSPIIVRGGGDFGIQEQVDIVKTDEASSIVSRHLFRRSSSRRTSRRSHARIDARCRGYGAGV